MKSKLACLTALTVLGLVSTTSSNALAQSATSAGQSPSAKVEYIDIRWDGVDRMCVVYPDGRVVFFGADLKDMPRPDDANKRAFYMTIEMNRLAAQGYEFVAMISDEIIMKRTVR